MKSEEVLKEIENKSEKQFLPIIGTYKAELFRKLLRKYEPKNALEIGTLVGYSAIIIASELPDKGKLTCLEIDSNMARVASENVAKAGLSSKVKILVGNAKKLIPNLTQKFDLVFIDAIKEEYYGYLKAVEKNLQKNSIVVADNVKIFADAMEKYLDYVRNSGKYKSKYIDVPLSGDAMEVSIKISN